MYIKLCTNKYNLLHVRTTCGSPKSMYEPRYRAKPYVALSELGYGPLSASLIVVSGKGSSIANIKKRHALIYLYIPSVSNARAREGHATQNMNVHMPCMLHTLRDYQLVVSSYR